MEIKFTITEEEYRKIMDFCINNTGGLFILDKIQCGIQKEEDDLFVYEEILKKLEKESEKFNYWLGNGEKGAKFLLKSGKSINISYIEDPDEEDFQ